MFHAPTFPARQRARSLVATFGLALSLVATTGSAYAATNTAPTISGTPKKFVAVGSTYAFRPTATDADGDTLTYSIANKPAWMWFSKTTGKLGGKPTSAQAGQTFSGIRISVSDGTATASLPSFWISVGKDTSTTTNHAPTISGTPVTTATVDKPYAWKPAASDVDGDALTFSITGKPAWASFDTTNGTLYGTPGASSVGTYSNIVIKVSDGKATSSLPAFAVTVSNTATKSVTLNWTKPTTNVDGTALTDLAGYTVSYGNTPGSYSTSLTLTGGATTSAVVEGLAAGTWYFVIKSRNTAGVESDYSGEVAAAL
jgi:hypothetical protein